MHIRILTALVVLGAIAGGGAHAQSTGAPAGRDPATAPGGTEGIAGPQNERNAIRDGDAVPLPPGQGGVEVDTTRPDTVMPTEAPPRN